MYSSNPNPYWLIKWAELLESTDKIWGTSLCHDTVKDTWTSIGLLWSMLPCERGIYRPTMSRHYTYESFDGHITSMSYWGAAYTQIHPVVFGIVSSVDYHKSNGYGHKAASFADVGTILREYENYWPELSSPEEYFTQKDFFGVRFCDDRISAL